MVSTAVYASSPDMLSPAAGAFFGDAGLASALLRNDTGRVYHTSTGLPSTIPGVNLSMRTTRSASASCSGERERTALTSPTVPSFFTTNCTMSRPFLPPGIHFRLEAINFIKAASPPSYCGIVSAERYTPSSPSPDCDGNAIGDCSGSATAAAADSSCIIAT